MYKKLFEAHLKYANDIVKYSNDLQFEMRRISKLWDKTEEMKFTLFSKKEILKLMDDENYDFQYQVKKRTEQLLVEIDSIIKSETAGSNE